MAESDRHSIPTDSADTTRPAKRRKFYRKRFEDDEPENSATAASETPPSISLTLDELVIAQGILPDRGLQKDTSASSIADIIRQRKAAQRKRAGIEFTNSTTASKSSPIATSLSKALIGIDEVAADLEAVVNRFAPQTGQVADVDKHM